MNYLITGGTGFIGSHLVDRLLRDGNQVTIIDRNIKFQNLAMVKSPNLKIYREDIFGKIKDLFKDIDIVVHTAALTRPQWSIKYPYETTEVNVLGTIRILELARDNKVKRFVLLSSSDLYGDTNEYPTSERAAKNPLNAYALSKSVCEYYCKLFKELYGLEYNIIRPFNAYGKKMPLSGYYTSAIATFINAFENKLPLEMFGTGEQRRDFVYIDDIVEMLVLLCNSKVKNEIFNCGFGKNYSINEVYDIVSEIYGRKLRIKRLPAQFEKKKTLADMSKATKLLKWKPKVDLEEGLRRTING
jgi:UDP-glucose 4-epimerase